MIKMILAQEYQNPSPKQLGIICLVVVIGIAAAWLLAKMK